MNDEVIEIYTQILSDILPKENQNFENKGLFSSMVNKIKNPFIK
jgi:hypothetical protein